VVRCIRGADAVNPRAPGKIIAHDMAEKPVTSKPSTVFPSVPARQLNYGSAFGGGAI
jgi:hypothetical protein